MVWIALIFAGLIEVAGAVALKYSDGFRRLAPTAVVFVVFAISFHLLAAAANAIPIGTAYAIWTGIGAAGTAVIGMVLFAGPQNLPGVVSSMLVVLGSVGMKLYS